MPSKDSKHEAQVLTKRLRLRLLHEAKVLGTSEKEWTEIDRILFVKCFKNTKIHGERFTTGDE